MGPKVTKPYIGYALPDAGLQEHSELTLVEPKWFTTVACCPDHVWTTHGSTFCARLTCCMTRNMKMPPLFQQVCSSFPSVYFLVLCPLAQLNLAKTLTPRGPHAWTSYTIIKPRTTGNPIKWGLSQMMPGLCLGTELWIRNWHTVVLSLH